MVVTFKDVLILEVYQGVTKKGTECGHVQFLDATNADVYDIWCFGEQVEKLSYIEPKSHINAISFDLRPDRSGGVRLIPAW